jgi:hypothetical protein
MLAKLLEGKYTIAGPAHENGKSAGRASGTAFYMGVSLDGFIAGPNDEVDRLFKLLQRRAEIPIHSPEAWPYRATTAASARPHHQPVRTGTGWGASLRGPPGRSISLAPTTRSRVAIC